MWCCRLFVAAGEGGGGGGKTGKGGGFDSNDLT